MIPPHEYNYRVPHTERVLDGDTLWAVLDLGFRMTATLPIRLYPWDCPELRSSDASPFEKRQAKRARELAIDWLLTVPYSEDDTLWVTTEKDPESFGRWLGDFWFATAPLLTLGTALFNSDLATRWPVRWHDTYDPKRDRV